MYSVHCTGHTGIEISGLLDSLQKRSHFLTFLSSFTETVLDLKLMIQKRNDPQPFETIPEVFPPLRSPLLSKMDMNFSAPIHQDPLLVADILDEAWASETLPVEDIEVPQSAIGNVEDDDAAATNEEEDDNKWMYLALDEFAPLTSAPAPNPEPVTRQNTSRRSECR